MIEAGELDCVATGCGVAARLSEDPRGIVRLLEGGPSGVEDAAIQRREELRPAISPCITTIMIGEKCAQMIQTDTRAPLPAAPPRG